jgi:outer membrane receptor protein involved in Fe transport
VNLNYTYTDSEVQVDADDVVFTLGGAGQPSPAINLIRDGSRMQGQSEHIANLQLGVEDSAAQTQATLLAAYASERISARGRPGQPDLIVEPGVIVDFVFRQGFAAFGQDMTFSLEARNLLGEDFEEYQELGGGRVDINTYELGRSFSVGLTVRF